MSNRTRRDHIYCDIPFLITNAFKNTVGLRKPFENIPMCSGFYSKKSCYNKVEIKAWFMLYDMVLVTYMYDTHLTF